VEARCLMARLPASISDLVAEFGPHLNREPVGGWHATGAPDRIVPTHCCFCGQQCGIQLKVKDNQVIGFEPWYDFPFNQGKLCPKGVKRYLQGAHPDRLLHAYARDSTAPGGFRQRCLAMRRCGCRTRRSTCRCSCRLEARSARNSLVVYGAVT